MERRSSAHPTNSPPSSDSNHRHGEPPDPPPHTHAGQRRGEAPGSLGKSLRGTFGQTERSCTFGDAERASLRLITLKESAQMDSSLEFSSSLGSVSSLLTRCRTFKVLVIGDSGVGKTCLTHRLSAGEFPCRAEATIGVDFRERLLEIDGEKIKVTDYPRVKATTNRLRGGCLCRTATFTHSRNSYFENLRTIKPRLVF